VRYDVELVAVGKSYDAHGASSDLAAHSQGELLLSAGLAAAQVDDAAHESRATNRELRRHPDRDRNVTDAPPSARGTSMMFQNYACFRT